ncbi:MAG: hypothetical protein WBE86_07570 [Candidatus Acidiferrales bacterium]
MFLICVMLADGNAVFRGSDESIPVWITAPSKTFAERTVARRESAAWVDGASEEFRNSHQHACPYYYDGSVWTAQLSSPKQAVEKLGAHSRK